MIRDRNELEGYLLSIINDIKHKRKQVEKINQTLFKLNVPTGTFSEVAKGDVSLSGLSTTILCILTFAIHETTNLEAIMPRRYFSERELEKAKKYEREINKDIIELPLEVSDMIMLDSENFIGKIKMTDLVRIDNSNLIQYIYGSQRSPKFRGIVPVPDINLKNVKEIEEHMLNGTYLPDTISLNIYSYETNSVQYNQRARSLIINEGVVISILDGFHRLKAGSRAVSKNSDLPQLMQLAVKVYDEEMAEKYFGQINTYHPVKKERLEELKGEKFSDVSTNHIQRKSDLKGKIASAPNINETAGQLTTFSILTNAIDQVFNPKNTFEAQEIGDYLIKFFNYLVGMFPDEFLLNPNKYRESGYINHKNVFIGYVVIAKKFQDNAVELKNIKDVVNRVDFSFKNKELKKAMGTSRQENTKRTKSLIQEYFENIEILDTGRWITNVK